MSDYEHFVRRKLSSVKPTGIASGFSVPSTLFPHQSALTAWALRRGRAAIFADTGLGKSRMQLAWADAVRRHTKRPVLILAPLAVAAQTEQEGRAIGIEATHCRDGAEAPGCGIVITNYDRLHRFDPEAFGAVVLDESSCIKHHDAKTLQTLLDAFKDTPFKLCTTATPAPNDWTELGTHAQFLGICTRQEMLAEFFTHDGGDTSVWRLKGHARQLFWRWVCQWGALVRRPSDLGFDDSAYALPPLHLHEHQVEVDMPTGGMLFAMEAQTLSERREALAQQHGRRVPMFLKIAPDLDEVQIALIAATLRRHGMDGVIATNTTLSREAVQGLAHAQETGGLSGSPVLQASNRVIAQLRAALGPVLPIIGVGGVMSGADARSKIEAGADLVQIYTGLIYKGPELVTEAARALAAR